MADTELFQEMGGRIVSTIFSSVLWFGIGIIIVVAVSGVMFYFLVYKRKFDIKVKIVSNRANDKNSIIFDKAAILIDRSTKTAYFRVWGLKRDFPVPKYEVLQSTNEGDLLEIYRESEDEFYFLTPTKISRKYIIKSDGKKYAYADQSQIRVDPEMGFWAQKRKTTNKKMFDTESLLMKFLPYLPHVFAGVIVIFILYILMDSLPQILSSLKELTEALARQQQAQIITPRG